MVTLYDDTSVNDGESVLTQTTINTEEYYNALAVIMPKDDKDVYYELEMRASGLENRITLKATKGSYMVGKIGGVLVFMFFVVGILAKAYSHLAQHIELANDLYRSKNNRQLGICDIFRYSFCYFFSFIFCMKDCIDRDSQLGFVKRLHQEIQMKLSIENVIKQSRTCLRLVREL